MGEGKWGRRGREVGGKGEGSGGKGGGNSEWGTPLSTPSICKTIWIFFYVFPVSGSGGVPYLKIVNFQSSDIRRNTEPG